MSGAVAVAPAARRPGPTAPVLPPPVARLVAFAGLGAWGGLGWSGMVAPAAGAQMTALLALGLALAGALLASGRAEGRRAHGGAVLGVVVLVLASTGAIS